MQRSSSRGRSMRELGVCLLLGLGMALGVSAALGWAQPPSARAAGPATAGSVPREETGSASAAGPATAGTLAQEETGGAHAGEPATAGTLAQEATWGAHAGEQATSGSVPREETGSARALEAATAGAVPREETGSARAVEAAPSGTAGAAPSVLTATASALQVVTATALSGGTLPVHHITLQLVPDGSGRIPAAGDGSQAPLQPQAAGIKYDNLVNASGFYASMGTTSNVGGTDYTPVLGDDIHLSEAVDGLQVSQVQLAVYNPTTGTILAITRVYFWYDDNLGGPGTYFRNASGEPIYYILFAQYAPGVTIATLETNNSRFTLPPGRTSFWAGVAFDNAIGGATAAQLQQLGQNMYSPPAVGGSADKIFQTTSGGLYNSVNNPPGSVFNFGGNPVANLGWQFTFGACPTQVITTADSGPGSLRNALDCAAPGGTVTFTLPANSDINVMSELVVHKPVTIDGSTAVNLCVGALDPTRIFSMTAPATMISLTVMDGNAGGGSGGGINSTSDLTLTHVAVLSNTADSAGGAHVSGMLTLNGGLFQNNRATGGAGGGLYVNGALAVSGTQFISNSAILGGGGAVVLGAATLNGALFAFNRTSTQQAGGLFAAKALTLTGAQFLSNTAPGDGGGVLANDPVILNGGLFQNNTSTGGNGGGLLANKMLNLTGTQFISNTAGGNGGALRHASGNGRIVNALFARNTSASQGAALTLASFGIVQILHSTIASPTAASGAAIYIAAGTVGITDTIVANYALGINNAGGALRVDYDMFFNVPNTISGTVSTGSHPNLPGNPGFVNPAMDDYHLGAGSAAIDVGTDQGVASDFEGDHRPIGGGFDLGYDEAFLRLFLPLIRR